MRGLKSIEKLRKYSYLLEILKKHCCGKKNCEENFKKIISYLDDDTLQFLAECIRNILAPNNINKLPKHKKNLLIKKLTPHKKTIKSVIHKKTSLNKRRKQIQNGGAWFLPLLGSIIPLVSSIIGNFIK